MYNILSLILCTYSLNGELFLRYIFRQTAIFRDIYVQCIENEEKYDWNTIIWETRGILLVGRRLFPNKCLLRTNWFTLADPLDMIRDMICKIDLQKGIEVFVLMKKKEYLPNGNHSMF